MGGVRRDKIKDWSEFLKDVPTDILENELNIRKKRISWYELFKSKEINEISFNIMTEIDNALSKYGKYTFSDKGPDEVMDIDTLISPFKNMETNEIVKTLKDVLDFYESGSNKDGTYSEVHNAINTIIHSLDDREDFDEILDSDKRFEY